jgi:O-acetylserine/cysteine efflux transporter
MAMKPVDIVLALVVPVLWGFGFTIAKPTMAHFPPLMLMAMTYGVTALCLCRRVPSIKTPFLTMNVLALFIATLQAGLIFYGLQGLPASTAVLLLQSSVPFSVLFAWPMAGEKPTPVRLVGMAISFAGIVVIVGAPEEASSWLPAMLVLAGSAVWAIGQVGAKRLSRDDGTTLTAAISLYALPQMVLASVILESGQWTAAATATLGDWMGFVAFAVCGFVLAYTIWYSLLRRYRVDQVTPISLLMPVIGVICGVLMLGESLHWLEVIGGAVVMAGLAVVVLAPGPAPAAAEAPGG